MHPHEQPPAGSAAPKPQEKYLTKEERLARIKELGGKAALVGEVYGLVTRKLLGIPGSTHGKLCAIVNEGSPNSDDSSSQEVYKGMMGEIVDFDSQLSALLSRSLHLSEDDMETIRTQWRLDNFHGLDRNTSVTPGSK